MTGCRIGKVKFKSGGSITILKTREDADYEWVFRDAIKELNSAEPEAVGYFIIGKHRTYTKVAGGHWPTIAGGADMMKAKIMEEWVR